MKAEFPRGLLSFSEMDLTTSKNANWKDAMYRYE